MNTIARGVFDEGKRDVERYFEFMREAVGAVPPTGESEEERGRREHLNKILKANSILLLYNLVEATVKSSLISLYYEINYSQSEFVHLTEKLRSRWIRYEVRTGKNATPAENMVYKHIEHVVASVVDSVKISFPTEAEFIPLSGNIDARKIKEVAGEHGFAHHPGGNELVRVKQDRNRLAHGDISFKDCGEKYSVPELDRIKKQVLEYLDKVIGNVEDFADQRRYLINP